MKNQYDKTKRWLVYFYDGVQITVTALNRIEAMNMARNQRHNDSEKRTTNVEQLS